MTNLSNIVEVLAQQALGNAAQQNQQGGLGGMLGSVLGQFGNNASSANAQGGLGGVLGSVLGQLSGAGQQLQRLFDDAEIAKIAQETQAPKQDIYNAISSVLPQIIDSLTPQSEQTGKTEANADIHQVMLLVFRFL